MALKTLQFRFSDDDSLYIADQSQQQNRAMGCVIGDILEHGTIHDVANALEERYRLGEKPQASNKKTQLLVPQASLDQLSKLSTTTGLPSELIIRLLIENKRLLK